MSNSGFARLALAGAAVLILFALSACTSAPASTPAATMTAASTQAAPGKETAPCHSAYVNDVDTRVPGVDTNVPGEPTPEAAAVAWAKSVLAPSGAPTVGWVAIDEQTARSGDWIVGVTRTVTGGWVVDGLGCAPVRLGPPQSPLH